MLAGAAYLGCQRTSVVKAAMRRRINRRGDAALDVCQLSLQPRIRHGHRCQQGFGVGMLRVLEQLFGLGQLNDLAQVHYRDPMAHVASHRQIVRDVEVRHVQPLRQVEHQVHDAGADGHVEHRGRLVRDDKAGLNHQRAGDGDALTLPAGKLVGEAEQETGRWREAHQREQFGHQLFAFGECADALDDQWLGYRVIDRQARIHGLVRVLKDHLHFAAELLDGRALESSQVYSIPIRAQVKVPARCLLLLAFALALPGAGRAPGDDRVRRRTVSNHRQRPTCPAHPAVKAAIPVFLWTEAVLRGKAMTRDDGTLGVGADRLDNNIKLIYAVATNILINQHANINRTAKILRDESLAEFIVVQDNFLTPTGRFADVLLPACTQFEMWGLEDGWKYGDEVILMPKLVEPLGESKSDYRICAELAERLGIGEAYTQGRDERAWVEWILDRYRATRFPGLPSLDEFEASNIGVYANPVTQPAVAFADFRADPEAHPLDTPSGKIEIFSQRLHDMNNPKIPAVPKYLQEWESPFGPEAAQYPLQAIGHHTLRRVHSTHENNDWLEEAFPQRVFINALDAQARGIRDGDKVKVYNDRGATIAPCRVTNRILPGVVDLPQGAWWTPDENGIDRRGSVNVLTSERWTPLAFGTAQHTIMVQVEKTKDE